MLKHEDAPQIRTQPAAQVRVTPEELAAAVTALQIRKEGQPGTIAIGDAVEELGLDVTPEEVLAELQARRERIRGRLQMASRKRKGIILASMSLLCLTGFGIYSAVGSGSSLDSSRLTPGTNPYSFEPQILVLSPVSPKPIVSTLAEAPSGKTVYCCPDAVEVAAMSRNAQEETPHVFGQDVSQLKWPVVKYGKDMYVRGWTRMPLSKKAAKLLDVEVFNKASLPQLGAAPQQVTLKLDLQTSRMGLSYQRLNPDGAGLFVFHNPRLIAHTYEKW